MVKIIRKNTAKDLIDFLRLSNPHWANKNEARSHWIFRGQADANWRLIPSIIRPNITLEQILDKDWTKLIDEENIPDDVYNQTIFADSPREIFAERWGTILNHTEAESTLVKLFVDACNLSGLAIPEDKTPYMTYQQRTQKLKRQTFHSRDGVIKHRVNRFGNILTQTWYYFEDVDIKGKPEQLYFIRIEFMLAQHHSVPTRLLDWTYDPLTAVYFVAHDSIHHINDHSSKPEHIAIWALWRLAYSHSDLIFDEPYTSKIDYLRAQRGLFSVDTGMDEDFLKKGQFRPVEDIEIDFEKDEHIWDVERDFFENPLIKITLPVTELSELRRLLSIEGYIETTVKPSFDSAGTFVRSTLGL